jgi:hypothetical protein
MLTEYTRISFLAGTHRRKHLYKMRPSVGTLLTPSQVESLCVIGLSYWAQHRPASLEPRPWNQDPVRTSEGRSRRALLVQRRAPTTPEEEYRLFRWCTLDLAARGR